MQAKMLEGKVAIVSGASYGMGLVMEWVFPWLSCLRKKAPGSL